MQPILRQEEQWPDRVGELQREAAYTGKGKYNSETKKNKAPIGGDVKRLKGKDTGLYGEDEDDTYDVYAKPSPDGKGFDVVRPIGR